MEDEAKVCHKVYTTLRANKPLPLTQGTYYSTWRLRHTFIHSLIQCGNILEKQGAKRIGISYCFLKGLPAWKVQNTRFAKDPTEIALLVRSINQALLVFALSILVMLEPNIWDITV